MKGQIKTFVKRFVLPVVGLSFLQPMYRLLHRVALVGMNIGPVGEIATSGEAVLAKKLMKSAPENAVVMDVGANFGEMAILCSRNATRQIRIFAFEPAPTIYAKLCTNIERAGQGAYIKPVPLGLSRENRVGTLYVADHYEGNSSLYSRPVEHLPQTAVAQVISLVTLDGFCTDENIDEVFYIKVDIEGEELACLQGGTKMIQDGRIAYLQFEFGGCNVQSRVFFKDFWDLLSPGYRIYRVLQNGLEPITKYHELTEVFSTTNFMAIRGDIPLFL